MKRFWFWMLPVLALGAPAAAQGFEFLPGTRYDPAVPTVQKVLGYALGERMSTHGEVERYVRAPRTR